MSNLKYDAITGSGIEVVERITIPEDLIPADARVEIDAKKAAGYYTEGRSTNPRRPSSGVRSGAGRVNGGSISTDY